MRWQFDGRDQQQVSRASSVTEIAFAMVSTITPAHVRFTAVNAGQTVLLNGARVVEIEPKTYQEVTKIQIGRLLFSVFLL